MAAREGVNNPSLPAALKIRLPLRELPFWLALLVWSLLPATRTPWIELAEVPVSAKSVLLLAIAGFYVLMWWPPRYSGRRWNYNLPLYTLGILAYAMISMCWSRMAPRDATAMAYVLLLTTAVFLLGYTLVAKRTSKSITRFLSRLTIALALVSLLYTAESFFSLGLRSEAGRTAGDFGVQRVRGPLYGSATGYFILIPALGFAIEQAIRNPRTRFIHVGIAFALVISLVALGSRGAMLLLTLFLFLVVFIVRKRKQRWIALAMVVVAFLGAATIVFTRARGERLLHLADEARVETHRTAWKIVANAPVAANILGSGYGSWWPWYLVDVEGARRTGKMMKYTPYGMILHQPHSVLLLFGVELGAVGLIYFAAMWLVLFRLLRNSYYQGQYSVFACAVVAAAPGMFIDYFLFRPNAIGVLYWIFLFGALALNRGDEVPQGSKSAERMDPA